MAKKTARHRKEVAQQRAIQQARANVSLATTHVNAPAAAPVATATPAHALSALSDEYHYVRRDLRRIALLAGSIVLVLVALSFVI